jgi:hypothetical protein
MKYTTLLLLILFSVNILGQAVSNIDKQKKIQIGISFSPDICYRSLFNQGGDWRDNEIIKVRNETEIPNFGYHSGVSFCYNFKKWLGLESGVQFSNCCYATKYIILHPLDPEPSLPDKIKTFYNNYYIGIPLKVNFSVGKKKVRFFSSLGLSVDLFLLETQLAKLKYSDGRIVKDRQKPHNLYKKILMSIIAGAGLDYKISQRLSLRIEPVFRYDVINIIDTPVTANLWDGGINIGFYVGL